jgi:hypothetical protein
MDSTRIAWGTEKYTVLETITQQMELFSRLQSERDEREN